MDHWPHPKLRLKWMDKNIHIYGLTILKFQKNCGKQIRAYVNVYKSQIECGVVITQYNAMVLHTIFQSQQQNISQTFSSQKIHHI